VKTHEIILAMKKVTITNYNILY